MADEAQVMAEPSGEADAQRREIQQALLESARRFADEVAQRSQEWLQRWPAPSVQPEAATITARLCLEAERLRREFGRPEGPALSEVRGAFSFLLDTRDTPGPLTRLAALIKNDPPERLLEDQRLLSDLDRITVRLSGLRVQWQEYLSLSAPRQSTSAQPITEPLKPLAPLPSNPNLPSADQDAAFLALLEALETAKPRPAAGQGESRWHGLTGTLKVMLALLAAVTLVVALAYEAAVHLPQTAAHPAPRSTLAPTAPNAPTTTPGAASTGTPLPQATATTSPQPTTSPTATSAPSPGTTQLSVNPLALTIPCPGTGATSLQLVNTGSQPLNWQATVNGASGEVLLDGGTSEQGHLNPGDEATISVTAETRGIQGTITITYSGAPGPITVGYTVGC